MLGACKPVSTVCVTGGGRDLTLDEWEGVQAIGKSFGEAKEVVAKSGCWAGAGWLVRAHVRFSGVEA